MRFAGGEMHGRPVDPELERHDRVIVEYANGGSEVYRRCIWFEYEGVGDGEQLFCLDGMSEDDKLFFARQVLRPH